MSIIATETEARSIGGSGTATDRLMCTKTRAEALGCKVAGTYDSNQLVQLSDLSIGYKTVTYPGSVRNMALQKGNNCDLPSITGYYICYGVRVDLTNYWGGFCAMESATGDGINRFYLDNNCAVSIPLDADSYQWIIGIGTGVDLRYGVANISLSKTQTGSPYTTTISSGTYYIQQVLPV